MEELSQNDMQELMGEGYSMKEIQEACGEMASEEKTLTTSYNSIKQSTDPRSSAVSSMFTPQQQENMIKWQLEVDNILERIEHVLRGDELTYQDGHLIWKRVAKEEDQQLNNYGVTTILRILSTYLNRNTILSNYDEKTINYKVLDFGKELNNLFFMKYEAYGMIGLEKRKNYPMMHKEIVDIVHSAYLRALHGGERTSLREARQVTQTENLLPQGLVINTGSAGKERGMMNPMRYIHGKYK